MIKFSYHLFTAMTQCHSTFLACMGALHHFNLKLPFTDSIKMPYVSDSSFHLLDGT